MAIDFKTKNGKTALGVAAVLLVGVLLGAAILRSEKTRPAGGEAHGAEEHGAKEHGDEHGHAHGKEAGKAEGKEAGKAPVHADEAAGHAEAGHEHGAESAAKPAEVEISDEQLRRNGVELASAGPARIRSSLQLLGEVRLNEDRSVVVVPRLAGLVESVHANAGDRVQRGQLLAVISSQALADQRSELLAAQKRLALARGNLEREQRLWEEKITAEQDVRQARQQFHETEIAAESARQKLAALGAGGVASTQGLTRFEIRATIAGVVTDKKISVGEVLKEDKPIFQLADLSSVWVELNVPAGELGRLKLGAPATVKAAAVPAPAEAKLAYVGALVGAQSRSASARLLLPNATGLWRPGLPVSVELLAADGETAVPLAIDADAVQTLEGQSVVFVREGPHFEARVVALGRSDGRRHEVLKGLAAGDRYAAKNSFLIKAEIGKAGAAHEH